MYKMIVTKILISKFCAECLRQRAAGLQIYSTIRGIGAVQPFEVFSTYDSLRVLMTVAVRVSYSSSKRHKDLDVRDRKKSIQGCRK